MKRNILKGLIVTSFIVIGAFALSLTSVNAESVYVQMSEDTEPVAVSTDTTYTLEQMLVFAIEDEYLNQAEYQAIIDTFGDIRPFTNVVVAEQNHIDLLLVLFETYGFEVPANNATDSVVVPDSITSAYATGIDAENANILMYQTFLAQADLPDDVKTTFEYLLSAAENHLEAFSKDHYSCLGTDMMNQFRNRTRSGNQNGTGNQYKGSNGSGTGTGTSSGSKYQGSNGNAGVCPRS